MANIVSKALGAMAVLLPKGKPKPDGVTVTGTYNPSNVNNILALPTYKDHLTDIFDSRAALDSRALIKQLLISDPDMSATLNAFLTVADTEMIYVVKDVANQIDQPGQLQFMQLLNNLTTRNDYATTGFKIVQSLNHLTEAMRYMVLAQGVVGGELILNKEFWPSEIRIADFTHIQWFEKKPGQFTPRQTALTGEFIDLDIPTFFATWFRQDPTTIYSQSFFVSAINTIAARQQVINDLYRIMRITGYPRMDVTVLEEVLLKNAPSEVRLNAQAQGQYIAQQLASISGKISSLQVNQAFVHTDSVTTGTSNTKSAGMAIDISSVIDTLNSQNQAGLKVMSTIIGRGESGVNTASTEARVFSMNAEAINKPIADLLSQIFTLSLRLTGSLSRVEVYFRATELRPSLELEPQYTMKAVRLKEDLSLGLITDEEYHMQMYNRLPPASAPVLSGTGFLAAAQGGIDASKASPNADPLGRSLVAPGSKSSKSNQTKAGSTKTKMTLSIDL